MASGSAVAEWYEYQLAGARRSEFPNNQRWESLQTIWQRVLSKICKKNTVQPSSSSLSSLSMVEMLRTLKRFTNSNGQTMPDLIRAESEVTAQYWLLAKVTHGFSAWVVKIWILGIWLQIRWWLLAGSHQKLLIQHVQNSASWTRCYANSSWLVRQVALEIFHQMPELSLG